MGPKGSSLLAAAIATAFPILDAQATEPAVRLAQTYGSEAMPGGVEARPTIPDNSRSFKKKTAPGAPMDRDFESMKTPQADDAGSATMPAPSPSLPPKDDGEPPAPKLEP